MSIPFDIPTDLDRHLYFPSEMNQSNMLSSPRDPTLPDLIPEGPAFEDLLDLDDWMTPTPYPDIVGLNCKMDSLTIESNTLGLRTEIERAKRQRLQASLRQVRRDLAATKQELIEIRSELQQFKDVQNTINYQLDSENARTNTLAFRSLTRISELLTTMIPGAPLSPTSSYEANILLQELTTTIQHFGVHYIASHG